jgi:ATP-binding cassette subfamily A (ABC1) protein 3
MAFGMYFVNLVTYILLALYLDQVFPNEWGSKKHPLFFLPCFNKPKESEKSLKVRQDSKNFSDQFEEVDLALKDLVAKNEAVVIDGLYKTYPSGKSAVKNLTL